MQLRCPECGTRVETVEGYSGRAVACPKCAAIIPVRRRRVSQDDETEDAEPPRRSVRSQTCPMCGTKNPARASTCRSCGDQLSESRSSSEDGRREKKHSLLGIASFVMVVTAGIFEFILFVVAGIMEESTPGGIDENSTGAILVGLGLFAGIGLDVLGIVLGVVALSEGHRNRTFAALGLAFGALLLLGICGLIGVGTMIE